MIGTVFGKKACSRIFFNPKFIIPIVAKKPSQVEILTPKKILVREISRYITQSVYP